MVAFTPVRVVAHCVAGAHGPGPLDGQKFSVDDRQTQIDGFDHDDDGAAVGRYVRDDSTRRPIEPGDPELDIEGDADGFDGHGIEHAADYAYDPSWVGETAPRKTDDAHA